MRRKSLRSFHLMLDIVSHCPKPFCGYHLPWLDGYPHSDRDQSSIGRAGTQRSGSEIVVTGRACDIAAFIQVDQMVSPVDEIGQRHCGTVTEFSSADRRAIEGRWCDESKGHDLTSPFLPGSLEKRAVMRRSPNEIRL
jgi:hypothetical protein